MPAARPRRLSLPLLTLLTACGGAGPAVAPAPAPSAPATMAASAPSPWPAVGTFATPGLPAYGATEGLPPNEAETRLRPAWSAGAGGPAPLACTAREYATRFAADRADPDPGTVAALAEHCGLWAPPPDVFAFTAPSLDAATEQLGRAPAEQKARPAALGAVTHPDGAVTVSVATMPAGLVLDPLPRTGATSRLAGRRTAGEGALWLYAAPGAREVTARPIVSGPNGDFALDLPEAAGPDAVRRYEIVRAEGPFLRSLAVLRRYEGAPPDRYAPPPAPLAGPGREAQEATLLGAVNVKRQAHGLPALRPVPGGASKLDGWLEAIARGASAGEPGGLQDERGWRFARVRYAFAAGVTAAQAIDLLADTPLGRRALLDPDDTEMGFGLRPFGAQPGHDVVVVPLQRFRPLEPAAARASLLTAVNGRRRTTSLPELQAAAPLEAVAQALAEQAQAGKVPWDRLVDAAGRELMLRQVPVSGYGAGGVNQATFDPAELVHDPGLQRKDMRAIGIGVASGPAPGGNEPRHVVVYLVADAVPKP